MKKLFVLFVLTMFVANIFAQRNWQTNTTDKCFCCSEWYNFPDVVLIGGPANINCGDHPTYTIKSCEGTTINWSVSPSVSFTGNGTNSITLTPPLNASSYTITVKITCNKKSVSGNLTVSVKAAPACDPSFNLTTNKLANGGYEIVLTPIVTSGLEHYWLLENNSNCSTCNAIPLKDSTSSFAGHVSSDGVFTPLGAGSHKDAGPSGYGFHYPGLPNQGCFRITHYISCCGVWWRITQCVDLTAANNGTGMRTTGGNGNLKSNPVAENKVD